MAEFGLIVPQGIHHLPKCVPALLDDNASVLTGMFQQLILRLLAHLKELDRQVKEMEVQIKTWHRAHPASRRLEAVPGIGPISASALVASVGDAKQFDNGRQMAAWLGVVPRSTGTGGKTILLGMSKRGDTYLRTLLIHGARAVIAHAQRRAPNDSWLHRLLQRRHSNVAAVALANKNARIVWALLAHDREFRADYVALAP